MGDYDALKRDFRHKSREGGEFRKANEKL